MAVYPSVGEWGLESPGYQHYGSGVQVLFRPRGVDGHPFAHD